MMEFKKTEEGIFFTHLYKLISIILIRKEVRTMTKDDKKEPKKQHGEKETEDKRKEKGSCGCGC